MRKMVSKQFTLLSMLMPVAMSIGTLISIYVSKNYGLNIAIVPIAGSALLVILLFYTFARARKKT